jgi:hypothetical protein
MRAVLLLAVLVLADLIFFRVPIFNGFTRLWGDHFDGGIEAAILEHWYNVVRGYSTWSQPNYFYPAHATLGYNDSFFLYGLLHSAFRALSFDIFVASQLVDITIRSIGFVSFFVLIRHVFGARFGWALLGATLFTIGHATFIHAFHQQLLSVSFAPLLLYLVVRAWEELKRDRPMRFALIGSAAAVLYGAWLLTGYYMAWFFALYAAALLIVGSFFGGSRFYPEAVALCLRRKWHALVVVGVLLAALVPFLIVYLPKASETGMHAWAEALIFSPAPNDAVNLGSGNFLFGRLYHILCAYCTIGNYEEIMGFPPILIYLFLFGWLWVLLSYEGPNTGLLKAIAVTTALTWLAVFRFGEHSAWKLIYDFVPGARAVRVISRYQIFLTLPVLLVIIAYLQGVAMRMPRAVAVLLGMLLVLEQLGVSPSVNDRKEILARIAAPPPPPECGVFFVTSAKGQDGSNEAMRRYPHNVEAMLISERLHIPTINGYATFLPPGWDFEDPTRDDYLDRVRRYAARYGIRKLCRLDLEKLAWGPPIM